MRILVVIAHYFKARPMSEWNEALGSSRNPLPRIAALNSAIVALHRYFGPYRDALGKEQKSYDTLARNTLDIVVTTVRDANILEWIGIDPRVYQVEFFDGPPLMLAFEAQRVMRERLGAYDLYAYFEDDLIVVDPAFFEKTIWFTEMFGPGVMLLPTRYEMSHANVPARFEFSPELSSKDTRLLVSRPGLVPKLTGKWNGHEQTFRLPNNPHSACFVVTAAQLEHWIASPTFYDRDVSFVDPLVSASTFAPGRVFSLYRPAEPDPWFLAIEHYGTRYSGHFAPLGKPFGESPLLAAAERAGNNNDALSQSWRFETISSALAKAADAEHRLNRLRRSRSELAKALAVSILTKWRR